MVLETKDYMEYKQLKRKLAIVNAFLLTRQFSNLIENELKFVSFAFTLHKV